VGADSALAAAPLTGHMLVSDLSTGGLVGIIGCVPQPHTAKALANPAQPHRALLHELERYIEAHNPDVTDVNVVSATDTGQADKRHKPVRHWYHVTYEA
jgi:hypothetical protein